ncbi:hypothetical protein M9458_008920, partial [Cirrhinus mrigala]
LMALKKESQELNKMEENQYDKHQDFITGEQSAQNEKLSSQKRGQKTESASFFTC